jgi:hypothetical protein
MPRTTRRIVEALLQTSGLSDALEQVLIPSFDPVVDFAIALIPVSILARAETLAECTTIVGGTNPCIATCSSTHRTTS